MDFIFELVADLIFEGSIEISKNKKISKWIRYPIIFLLLAFFLLLFGFLGLIGIMLLVRHGDYIDILGGLFMIVIDVILIVSFILKMKKNYIKNTNSN